MSSKVVNILSAAAGILLFSVGSSARSGAPSLWVEQVFFDGKPLLVVPGGAG